MSDKRVAIGSVGDEILRGEIQDTNGEHIARELRAFGFRTTLRLALPDRLNSLLNGIELLVREADLVILGGGLGATPDDITRDAIAQYTNCPLVLSQPEWEKVQRIYQGWGEPLPVSAIRQAQIPRGSYLLPNATGTAAGFVSRHGETWIAALPGVPSEMKGMLNGALLPFLQGRLGVAPRLHRVDWMIYGITETQVGDMLAGSIPTGEGITYGVYVSVGTIHVVLEVDGAIRDRQAHLLQELHSQLSPWIYAERSLQPVEALASRLAGLGWKAAVVEAGSAGSISAVLAQVGVLAMGEVCPDEADPVPALKALSDRTGAKVGIAVGKERVHNQVATTPVLLQGSWGEEIVQVRLPAEMDQRAVRLSKAAAIECLRRIAGPRGEEAS